MSIIGNAPKNLEWSTSSDLARGICEKIGFASVSDLSLPPNLEERFTSVEQRVSRKSLRG